MGTFRSTFGSRLKALREAAGLTQAELEKRAGMSSTQVAQYETGRRQPTFRNLQALCRALAVDLDAFAGCTEKAPA